ncbi:hypothetical protein JMJ77_0001578, partial [Colletotrichum scovillei]
MSTEGISWSDLFHDFIL